MARGGARKGLDLAGGVDLRQLAIPPHTETIKVLKSCHIGFVVLRNDAGEAAEYMMILRDPQDHTEYRFGFEQELRGDMTDMLLQLPKMGSKIEEEESGEETSEADNGHQVLVRGDESGDLGIPTGERPLPPD